MKKERKEKCINQEILENGVFKYLGRIDFQVKIYGQRIELSEIENTIKEINSIKYCAVIDKEIKIWSVIILVKKVFLEMKFEAI